MRTALLTILFIFFSFLPFARAQNYYAQKVSAGATYNHPLIGGGLHRLTGVGGVDSSYIFLDYYMADSAMYGPNNFIGMQGQLINSAYNYPADTTNSYKATSMFFMNYDCINAISVAFDSIIGYSEDTIALTQIDTLYLPIVQVNHSGLNDTLDIQITTVDEQGYPFTNTYEIDTLIIDSNHINNIGAGNDYTVKIIKWNLSNYPLHGGRFAVNVTYLDSTKQDSCWFIYGYGSFLNTCSNKVQGTNYFAKTTHFSNIDATPKDFFANSFAQWNEYASRPFLPDKTGDNVYYPCDTSIHTFNPATDGVNYLQDIDIAAQVLFTSYLSIPALHLAGISVNQNYPNPFNNLTIINYNLVKQADVSLKVIDLMGREIASQSYGIMSPGQHSISLNANNLSAGVYFYSITSSGYTITKKMVVY